MSAHAPVPAHRLCCAPMMDCTDRHARYLLRLISPRAVLYTEMISSEALLRGDRQRLLRYDPAEHPLALQLGGSDPRAMAACARMGEDAGYDEININAGCPSDRVQAGRFGACLMAEPERVAACVQAMRESVAVPVTLKTRIGIDRDAGDARLRALVEATREAGCRTFVVHARNAWLDGLSPRENREVPPLRYALVYALKRAYPELEVVINGGIRTSEAARRHLAQCDGVMLGREAYANPYILAALEAALFADPRPALDRHAVLAAYLPYLERQLAEGVAFSAISRHLLGLFHGLPGARAWRRAISGAPVRNAAGAERLRAAAALVGEPPAAGPAPFARGAAPGIGALA